jgi:hypothetical protein
MVSSLAARAVSHLSGSTKRCSVGVSSIHYRNVYLPHAGRNKTFTGSSNGYHCRREVATWSTPSRDGHVCSYPSLATCKCGQYLVPSHLHVRLSVVSSPSTHTHTRTRTRTHTRVHTHTHGYARTHARTHRLTDTTTTCACCAGT